MYGLIVPAGVSREVAEALERFVEYAVPNVVDTILAQYDEEAEDIAQEMAQEALESSLQNFLRDGEVNDARQ